MTSTMSNQTGRTKDNLAAHISAEPPVCQPAEEHPVWHNRVALKEVDHILLCGPERQPAHAHHALVGWVRVTEGAQVLLRKLRLGSTQVLVLLGELWEESGPLSHGCRKSLGSTKSTTNKMKRGWLSSECSWKGSQRMPDFERNTW